MREPSLADLAQLDLSFETFRKQSIKTKKVTPPARRGCSIGFLTTSIRTDDAWRRTRCT